MEEAEVNFMRLKYEKGAKLYMKIMNFLLVTAGVVPLLVATGYFIYTRDPDMFLFQFVTWLSVMVVFFIVIATIYYLHELLYLYLDIKYRTKTIERCLITEKKYMSINNTYHFIINSNIRYSLEVSENDYLAFEVGDEINIEYSTWLKEFFGYY